MSENEALKAQVAALEARVEGLDDLLLSAGEWLRTYADYAASEQPGKVKPTLLRGSPNFTAKQHTILDGIFG